MFFLINRFSKILLLIIGLGLLTIDTGEAQTIEPRVGEGDKTTYQLSSELYTATDGSLPFWFYSNVHGKVDPASTNWLNEISVNHHLLETDALAVDIGGTGVFRLSENNAVLLPKAYLTANAYGLQLDIGRFSQPIGLNNHHLSSGSMMVSNNAMPVPKVSVSTPDFMGVPFTDGHVEYKGMFSHGWFEEDRHVESPYLHQKYFYLKLNLGSWSGIGGIVHNAQWGGTDPDRGKLPQSFGDYIRLITGQGADESSNAPGGEVSNVIGNSVAAYDFGLQYKQENFSLMLTRMFYLEDKVSTRFRSPWDGVWGANLIFENKNRALNAITYEHINTKNQDAKDWELIGRRDYYDNFVYGSGWTYENRTLGTPLILFNGNTITNNVIVGHHLAFKGRFLRNLGYKAFITYSRNYGVQNDWVDNPRSSIPKDDPGITPRENFREDQYSGLFALRYGAPGNKSLTYNFKISVNSGGLYKGVGFMFVIQWSGGF